MKVLISSLGIILGSSFSLATTHGFFNNATKVAIVIQGDDSDASRLYDALNVEEHEIKTIKIHAKTNFKKELILLTKDNEKVLNITCSRSTLVKNFGSCAIELWNAPWMVRTSSSAHLILDNTETVNNAIALFSAPDSQGIIYESLDRKLSIKLQENASSQKIFSLEYR